MFHTSPDGISGRCSTTPERCPFKSDHYRTRQEADFHATKPEPLTLAEQTLSRKVAFLLRHHPEQAGLEPDKHGQVPTKQLAEKLNVTTETLTRIVYLDSKQRYLLTDKETHISAVQGHSYPVELRPISTTPPAVLFHGTKEQFLDSILSSGLRPGSRQHVHLSAAVGTATEVAGRRKGENVLLAVDTKVAIEAGVKFQQAPNGVWLAPTVPASALTVQ